MNASDESPRDMMGTADAATELERLCDLRDRMRALVMATVDEDGFPNLSSLPYLWYDEAFWVLMSDLSPHTAHVQANPTVEIMLIEDEGSARNIYGRLRANWRADVTKVASYDSRRDDVLAGMRSRHGSIVELLTQLSDFHLHRLSPGSGRLVGGFGKAFRIDGFTLVEHLRGK